MTEEFIPGRFDGQTALVTGAASGIGRAVTARLVAEGARVAGLDINTAALAELADELGASFLPLTVDVTAEGEISAAVAETIGKFGQLNAAFNIAGASRNARIVDMPEEDWDFTIDLVQKSVFLCVKHEARAMRTSPRGGNIVNVASVNARMPMAGGSPYATGKAGVEMFTRNAALELAPDGIRVNAVLPGLVDTPLVAVVLENEQLSGAYLDRIPLAAPATPAQIAGPCLYLASADASYVTGASLAVDGGWTTTGYPRLGL